jgi:hypothetical protein
MKKTILVKYRLSSRQNEKNGILRLFVYQTVFPETAIPTAFISNTIVTHVTLSEPIEFEVISVHFCHMTS